MYCTNYLIVRTQIVAANSCVMAMFSYWFVKYAFHFSSAGFKAEEYVNAVRKYENTLENPAIPYHENTKPLTYT